MMEFISGFFLTFLTYLIMIGIALGLLGLTNIDRIHIFKEFLYNNWIYLVLYGGTISFFSGLGWFRFFGMIH